MSFWDTYEPFITGDERPDVYWVLKNRRGFYLRYDPYKVGKTKLAERKSRADAMWRRDKAQIVGCMMRWMSQEDMRGVKFVKVTRKQAMHDRRTRELMRELAELWK